MLDFILNRQGIKKIRKEQLIYINGGIGTDEADCSEEANRIVYNSKSAVCWNT